MSGKWFANHGQALATICTVGSFFVTLLANWNTIQQHQDLLAWWPVITVPLTVYVAFRLGRLSRAPKEVVVPSAAPAPTVLAVPLSAPIKFPNYSERFDLDDDSLFIATQTVRLGDYWEVGRDLSRLKISPLAFKDTGNSTKGVEIRFDTQGSVFYGGPETKEIATNRFVLATTPSGFQAEPRCAYQFSFSEKHVHLKILRVHHINTIAKEVVLELCQLELRKRSRQDP